MIHLAVLAWAAACAILGAGLLSVSIARQLRQGASLAGQIGALVALGVTASVALSVVAVRTVNT